MTPSLTAAEFFAAALEYQTDPADLADDRASGRAPVVIDVRSEISWRQGRIPGAAHIPHSELADRLAALVPDRDEPIVVYCWGPGCNAATRGALIAASLGYARVRELIGGFEYWAREGFAVESDAGRSRRAPDPLTAPTEG